MKDVLGRESYRQVRVAALTTGQLNTLCPLSDGAPSHHHTITCATEGLF
jgi:hypothetical protein